MRIFKKQVIICGSMTYYNEMRSLKEHLAIKDINCIIPGSDDDYEKYYSSFSFEDYKRKISFDYLKKIKQLETHGIIVVNIDKHGINSYIGPNSFAEIVIAHTHNKKVYLLNDIPDVYFDELSAWDVKYFHGNIDLLFECLYEELKKENSQMELFDDL